jgi:hypothetical protein
VLAEAMQPMLAGRALLGAGRLDQAIPELERALAAAREAGATGTAALAAAALEQALLLAGRPPAGRAPAPPAGEVEAEAIRAESGGLAALATGAAKEAAAAFAGAADRWRQLGLTVWPPAAPATRPAPTGSSPRPARSSTASAPRPVPDPPCSPHLPSRLAGPFMPVRPVGRSWVACGHVERAFRARPFRRPRTGRCRVAAR